MRRTRDDDALATVLLMPHGRPRDGHLLAPPGPDELSPRRDGSHGTRLMIGPDEDIASVVPPMTDELTGPLSDELTVARGRDVLSPYAPFITSRWTDGPEVSSAMSLFGPYEVVLLETTLTALPWNAARCSSCAGAFGGAGVAPLREGSILFAVTLDAGHV